MDNYNINQEFRHRGYDQDIVLERHEFSEKIHIKELREEYKELIESKKYKKFNKQVNKLLSFEFTAIELKEGFDAEGIFIMMNITIEAEENYDDMERITIKGEIEELIFNLTE